MTIRKRNSLRRHLASALAERAGDDAMLALTAIYDAEPPEERLRYVDRAWDLAFQDAARHEYAERIKQGLPQLRAALATT